MAAEVLTFLLPLAGVMAGPAAGRAAAGLCPAGLCGAPAGCPPPTLHAVSSSPATAPKTASQRPRRRSDSPIPRTMGLAFSRSLRRNCAPVASR